MNGGLLMLLILYGIGWALAAFCGLHYAIDHHLGLPGILAGVVFAVCVYYKAPLLLTLGAFLGMWQTWHWDWPIALLAILPALLFSMPGVIEGIQKGTLLGLRQRRLG